MTKNNPKSKTDGRKRVAKSTAKGSRTKANSANAKPTTKTSKAEVAKSVQLGQVRIPKKTAGSGPRPIIVKHEPIVPEGLPKKYFLKSTFNTHDIMHAPVEKTLKMLDKILTGERLFTM